MRPFAAIQISVVTAFTVGASLAVAAWLGMAPPPLERINVTPTPTVDLSAIPAIVPIEPPSPEARPILPPEPVRCCACIMEDNRRRSREQQQTIEARFLGVTERRDMQGNLTNRRCTADHKVWASIRFALTGHNPWTTHPDVTPQRLSRMSMLLPCPELSRAAYLKMFDIFDGQSDQDEDGLGTAPVLQRGKTYKLRVVDGIDLIGDTDDTTELSWTLLAVDSL